MVLTINDFQEKVLDANGIVFVEFFASWCPHCQAFAPEYAQISEQLGNQAAFYQVEIDQSRELADAYNIEEIPTIIVFFNGEQVDELIGAQPESVFEEIIERLNQY